MKKHYLPFEKPLKDLDFEIEKLSNCFSISLGSRILRSDTASTSALSYLQSIIASK